MGIIERKEREKQMRRDLILQSAEAVFFEKGLRAATIDDIAAKAEVSKGTIYLYFSSKEDLYYSLISHGLSVLLKIFQDSKPEERRPWEAITGFSEAYFRFSQEQSYLYKMLAATEDPVVSEQVSPEVLSQLQQTSDHVLSYVAQFVQKGIETGDFRKDVLPYDAVILFWVSLSGILNLKARAAIMVQHESITKDSVVCLVDYNSLYDQCVRLLMNFLIADSIQFKDSLKRGNHGTSIPGTSSSKFNRNKHKISKHSKSVK